MRRRSAHLEASRRSFRKDLTRMAMEGERRRRENIRKSSSNSSSDETSTSIPCTSPSSSSSSSSSSSPSATRPRQRGTSAAPTPSNSPPSRGGTDPLHLAFQDPFSLHDEGGAAAVASNVAVRGGKSSSSLWEVMESEEDALAASSGMVRVRVGRERKVQSSDEEDEDRGGSSGRHLEGLQGGLTTRQVEEHDRVMGWEQTHVRVALWVVRHAVV